MNPELHGLVTPRLNAVLHFLRIQHFVNPALYIEGYIFKWPERVSGDQNLWQNQFVFPDK